MTGKRKIGIERMDEIIGEKASEIRAIFESISPDFERYVTEYAYGDLYARDKFQDKHRELAAVSCLIGQGNTGLPLKAHLQAMINVGWSKEDIVELLIFLSGYVGFPNCVDAILLVPDLDFNGCKGK